MLRPVNPGWTGSVKKGTKSTADWTLFLALLPARRVTKDDHRSHTVTTVQRQRPEECVTVMGHGAGKSTVYKYEVKKPNTNTDTEPKWWIMSHDQNWQFGVFLEINFAFKIQLTFLPNHITLSYNHTHIKQNGKQRERDWFPFYLYIHHSRFGLQDHPYIESEIHW